MNHLTHHELITSSWLNADKDIRLSDLAGRVVVVHTFQMLCPGCVSHGIPQALKIRKFFSESDVVVLGLHTVFEHHQVMGKDALEVFLQEYRINFPVGIDQADEHGSTPLTMQAYNLQGTPSLLIFDKKGQLKFNHFGAIDDMVVGAIIGQLISEV
jgi:hypothetical protein